MDISKVFYKVFGEHITNENVNSPGVELSLPEHMSLLSEWMHGKVNEINQTIPESCAVGNRIGPELVVFDVEQDETLNVSIDKLSVESRGTFCTIKANCCVFGGKWMYELQLRSKGVMQVGWCSSKCEFSTDTGVGDTRYSYGFDGSKQQIWHVYTTKYGRGWQSGDIIGICLDMDNEKIEYYLNGDSMGIAFNSIEKGPGLVLYPAVSMAFNESVTANFGGSPFRHPVSGYHPLQVKPEIQLQKAELLLQYLVNLAGIVSRQKFRSEKSERKFKENKSPKKMAYTLIAGLLIERLSPLIINSYVIEDKLYPYVKNLCVLRSEADKDTVILPGSVESTLGTLLTFFWSYMEEEEVKPLLKMFLNMLLSMFRQTPQDLDYERQRKVIVVLTCVCNHPQTRKFFIEHKFFKRNCLPLFVYLRPPEYSLMVNILPDDLIWTQGIGGSREGYLQACDKLSLAVQALYNLQKNLLITLLNNEDGSKTSPSSRKIFLSKLRKYVMDNSLEHRAFFLLQATYNSLTESPIALSFVCILIDITKSLFAKEQAESGIHVNPKYFFDGSFRYFHFDRVGGVLSHLKKVFRNEISAQLGNDPEALANFEANDLVRSENGDVYSAMFLISGNANTAFSLMGRAHSLNSLTHDRNTESRSPQLKMGNMSPEQSLHELLDLAIIYYYAVGHKHVVKIAAIRDEIANLNDVLTETTQFREDVTKNLKALNDVAGKGFAPVNNEILTVLKEKFGQRESVFAKRSIELARKQAWYRSVALGIHRRSLLVWLLDKVLETLKKSSALQQLFAFVPEIYVNILPILLDTILDFSVHDVSIQHNLSDAEQVIMQAAEFLGCHSADSRVILAACKDALLQALGSLTCHEAGIQALERASSNSQLSLIRALLRPYENRAWGQSNWLLLRFWLGDGFAYRESRPASVWQGGNKSPLLGLYRGRAKNETHTGLLHHIAPACPSKHFQQVIGNLLMESEPFSTSFLNSVLSQLNWAFSEFILLLQEIQNTSNRQEGDIVFEPRQLKICSMCFELTVSLMRSLELIIAVAPGIFLDASRPNSDLILNRVCQLVSQVLSRVTIPPGCFQYVLDLCLPDLSSVTHFAIISAALGILLALLREEMNHDVKPIKISRVTRTLLTDPSFQIANIEFALGEVKSSVITQTDIPRGNFDPKSRAHIDPLTNDIRIAVPSTSKRIRADPPVLKFNLLDYPTHVNDVEIAEVRRLIDLLLVKQTLLSDITLPSEDSLCPICCAKPVSVVFTPCQHQSCSNCILQHLMNSKVCFYCKSLIKDVTNSEGAIIYKNTNYVLPPQDISE